MEQGACVEGDANVASCPVELRRRGVGHSDPFSGS